MWRLQSNVKGVVVGAVSGEGSERTWKGEMMRGYMKEQTLKVIEEG